MERDDRQTPAGCQRVNGAIHRLLYSHQLIIDRNADRLKAALGRMLFFAACCRRHCAADDIRELDRGFNRLLLSGAVNLRRIALLAVFLSNAAQLCTIPLVDNLIGRQLLLLIHAHIEPCILHIGEAALGDVQLRR